MSHSISKLIGAAFLSLLFAATTAAQSPTPEAVVDDFVKAWNAHDVRAFDRLFTADAVWVPVAEARVVGHADVIKGFEEIHTTWAKETAIAARDIKVQSVRPDIVVILFHAKFMEHGKEVPVLDRAMIIVAVKQVADCRWTAHETARRRMMPPRERPNRALER